MSTAKSPEFYEHYPKLFHSFFITVPQDIIEELSEAGYLYYQSILCLDAVIDDQNVSQLLQAFTYQEKAIIKLTHIFGKDSLFWNYWNQRKKEYQQAIFIEKELHESTSVTFSQYKDLADYKSTFGKVAIDSLYFLTGAKDKELYNTLLESHYYFSVGFQIYDDIKDFHEDFQKGQFNWAVYKVYNSLNENEKNLPPNILNKLFFIRGIGQNLLKESSLNFKKSKEILKNIEKNSLWEKTINEMEETISNYLDETEGYLLILQKNIELENIPVNKNIFFDFSKIGEYTIKNGLEFIKKDFSRNFSEIKHIMYLSNRQGFSNTEPIQISDIFQRAMLNDCLYYVAKKYNLEIDNYLNEEARYFIKMRRKDNVGAWSYYPEVNEIASDIDDLGQIIQFFKNSERTDLIKIYCNTAIEITLKDRVNSNGGIETWIIPKDNQTELQQKQEYYNKTKWGTGPDVEVVANFIYALKLLQNKKYQNHINKAINYITLEQNKEGYWISRWYYSKFYGNYVCLRALSEYGHKYGNYIIKSLKFITENQNKDGGWGENELSTAMDTALALLSLKLFRNKNLSIYISKAENYLESTQNKNGCWNDTDFIKPKASLPYKSKVLTTAFVLKALSI